jgi:hypothetical protein
MIRPRIPKVIMYASVYECVRYERFYGYCGTCLSVLTVQSYEIDWWFPHGCWLFGSQDLISIPMRANESAVDRFNENVKC